MDTVDLGSMYALKTDKLLTKDQAERLRETFSAALMSGKNPRMVILDDGMSIERIGGSDPVADGMLAAFNMRAQ